MSTKVITTAHTHLKKNVNRLKKLGKRAAKTTAVKA